MVWRIVLMVLTYIMEILWTLRECRSNLIKTFQGWGTTAQHRGILETRRRYICGMQVTRYYPRKVAKVFMKSSLKTAMFDGRCELDSHADTFVAGRNCILMHYTERVCDVMPYSDE